jgi:hypothetical protein
MPYVTRRDVVLFKGNDPRWRSLFERADVVSEGAARGERHGARSWYGSTSLVVQLDDVPQAEHAVIAGVAERDGHVRLRAMRIAIREAMSRAPSPLGIAHCEMKISPTRGGLRIDVDVQAPLIESSVGTATPTT